MKGKLKNGLELDLEAGMSAVYLAEDRCMLFAGSEMER